MRWPERACRIGRGLLLLERFVTHDKVTSQGPACRGTGLPRGHSAELWAAWSGNQLRVFKFRSVDAGKPVRSLATLRAGRDTQPRARPTVSGRNSPRNLG